MKIIFLILCAFAVAVHGHRKADSKSVQVFHECLEENDIKEEDLEKFKDEKDPKMRCIMACVLEKRGILKNGEIDDEAMKKDFLNDLPEIGEQKVSEIIDSCIDSAKNLSDICEKTSAIGICVKKELDKMDLKFDD